MNCCTPAAVAACMAARMPAKGVRVSSATQAGALGGRAGAMQQGQEPLAAVHAALIACWRASSWCTVEMLGGAGDVYVVWVGGGRAPAWPGDVARGSRTSTKRVLPSPSMRFGADRLPSSSSAAPTAHTTCATRPSSGGPGGQHCAGQREVMQRMRGAPLQGCALRGHVASGASPGRTLAALPMAGGRVSGCSRSHSTTCTALGAGGTEQGWAGFAEDAFWHISVRALPGRLSAMRAPQAAVRSRQRVRRQLWMRECFPCSAMHVSTSGLARGLAGDRRRPPAPRMRAA